MPRPMMRDSFGTEDSLLHAQTSYGRPQRLQAPLQYPNKALHLARRRQQSKRLATPREGQETATQQASFLSDLIAFQSDKEGATPSDVRSTEEAGAKAEELIERATNALDAARSALDRQQQRSPSRPTDSVFTYASNRTPVKADDRDREGGSGSQAATRSVLENALSGMDDGSIDTRGSGAPSSTLDSGSGSESAPPWTRSRDGGSMEPQLQQQEQASSRRQLDFAEPRMGVFDFTSQDALDVEAAKSAVLPPFQSIMELTSAAAPPQRGAQPGTAISAASTAGRTMQDGEGMLADGTRYKRESGETKGKNGYWYRWTKLSGISRAGQVEWEEKWWEASDWVGMKEMGAEKSGCRADGAAWRETWREAIGFDSASGEPMVERSAHKWAQDSQGDEWEEKWGEHYWSKGRAHKWADKWGKEGPNVWHERWGEDYPGDDACFKYTDKWAERRLEGGATEQWGDKWEEDFALGKGSKKGETWSVDAAGSRYQRWWGENHFGNGWVQKYGNSTTGETWDASEQMDTYYNPIPHFGYRLALDHSPTLKAVPQLPRAGDDLGEGVGSL